MKTWKCSILSIFILFLSACAPQDVYICVDDNCQLNSCEAIDGHIICTPKESPADDESAPAIKYHIPAYNAKYGICTSDADYADIYLSQDGGANWNKISSDSSLGYDFEVIDGRHIHWLNIGQPYGRMRVELHGRDSALVRAFDFDLQFPDITAVDQFTTHYDGGVVGESCR
jgi:hypothetical protein